MKTVLVTGANGQLGSSIHARISQYPGYNFLFTDIDTLVDNYVKRNIPVLLWASINMSWKMMFNMS
jgi:dTDP-4-dehydrorhamnose reductase